MRCLRLDKMSANRDHMALAVSRRVRVLPDYGETLPNRFPYLLAYAKSFGILALRKQKEAPGLFLPTKLAYNRRQ